MKPIELPILGSDPTAPFPPHALALEDPNGLLAIGGDLHPDRLLNAYRNGIFPWYSAGRPIMWWSPDPRAVFHTSDVHLSRSSRRALRLSGWRLTADTAFKDVVDTCARIPRRGQHGTWITPALRSSFQALHRLGHAHSIEIHQDDHRVGGLYGLAIGRAFFAESMYSAETGGSKAALAGLASVLREWGWPLIDAQVENNHLLSLGARRMPRTEFLSHIGTLCLQDDPPGSWRDRIGDRPIADLID
ncbi:MAG: leucyl/phenylalanyl-tRNA--protein transferase [Xanthomonadaceae bacterium]|nr:leucyl/phenylalanyl-tRNA--protein transferase [Xanthomonadaceae bacterium]